MLNIGCHLSVSKGFEHMGKEALEIGANTFQYFSRNPRGSKVKKIDEKDIEGLIKIIRENRFPVILAHAPYTLNPCAADTKIREFAHLAMKGDLENMEYLPGNLYTFHPGSHVGQGVEEGIELISGLLNNVLKADFKTTVLLETMSGKGSEVGSSFEELRKIIDRVELEEMLGVCFDTCHTYSAGYDIVNNLDGVLEEFDRIVGLERLKAIHLNDSMTEFGSRKDRHAAIGDGSLGLPAIVNIINHPLLRKLPFYLETPNELTGYAREIKLLREHYRE
ncbi:MAG: endonuclease 4 [Firmicutes bacterium]|nr:endonuclease 4 [Bacillota bacterium]